MDALLRTLLTCVYQVLERRFGHSCPAQLSGEIRVGSFERFIWVCWLAWGSSYHKISGLGPNGALYKKLMNTVHDN